MVTTPTFATRRDARRFFVGTALFFAGVGLYLAYLILSITRGTRIVESGWFFVSGVAFALVMIGGAIRTGPLRRATGTADHRGFTNPFRRTGLYSRAGMREAIRVARSGPKGPPPMPETFPQLFAERGAARSFLVGTFLIPLGFIMPLVLSTVFAGTDVHHTTPGWVGFVGMVWVVGLVLVVLPISRFLNRQDALPPEQKVTTRRSWLLFLSSDGMRQAFHVAFGR